MPFDRSTNRRLLDRLHPGNRFKLMFGIALDESEPDVKAFRQACHAASESCPPSIQPMNTASTDTPAPAITSASVRVMRSYDYNHFEVTLNGDVHSLADVDRLRKEAARLADKAVQQFQIAKASRERRDRIRDIWRLKEAHNTPENERTPTEKAIIKYHSDEAFAARFNYDYDDDWHDPAADMDDL